MAEEKAIWISLENPENQEIFRKFKAIIKKTGSFLNPAKEKALSIGMKQMIKEIEESEVKNEKSDVGSSSGL